MAEQPQSKTVYNLAGKVIFRPSTAVRRRRWAAT